jgi:hypothetical protein
MSYALMARRRIYFYFTFFNNYSYLKNREGNTVEPLITDTLINEHLQ